MAPDALSRFQSEVTPVATKTMRPAPARRSITNGKSIPWNSARTCGRLRSAMTDVLPEAQKAALLTRIPAGDLGTGEAIGAAVVYLASREAGYVTGQTLHVNGGMAMI